MNVVVGAGSGLGKAVALAIADRGPLLLVDMNGAAVQSSPTPWGLGQGARDKRQRSGVGRSIGRKVDLVEALVITAGLGPSSGAGEPIYEVNLVGMARVLQALEPKVSSGSAAVCVASIAGHMARPGHLGETYAVLDDPLAPDFVGRLAATGTDVSNGPLAYTLSKTGVVRMARRLAPSWGKVGARIKSVSPGVFDTPMARGRIRSGRGRQNPRHDHEHSARPSRTNQKKSPPYLVPGIRRRLVHHRQ